MRRAASRAVAEVASVAVIGGIYLVWGMSLVTYGGWRALCGLVDVFGRLRAKIEDGGSRP